MHVKTNMFEVVVYILHRGKGTFFSVYGRSRELRRTSKYALDLLHLKYINAVASCLFLSHLYSALYVFSDLFCSLFCHPKRRPPGFGVS